MSSSNNKRYSVTIHYTNNKESDIIYMCISKLNRGLCYVYARKLRMIKIFFNTVEEIMPIVNNILKELGRQLGNYDVYDHKFDCWQRKIEPDSDSEDEEEPEDAPVRRSARIAYNDKKFGPTSYVGMDTIVSEDEDDGITDIWYDNSVYYDSDYESPEEIKLRLQKEKQARIDERRNKFFVRKPSNWAKKVEKEMKKELAEAKKANEQMDLDIQEQIAEDIDKLTLDPTKLSDEDYYQILKIKQNTNQELTWNELNFMVWHNDNARDNIRDQKMAQATPWSIDNMITQSYIIRAKLPPGKWSKKNV